MEWRIHWDRVKDDVPPQEISMQIGGWLNILIKNIEKTKIVYVFLSNRIHPDAENKKLVKLNVRTDIMQAIYNAIGTGQEADWEGLSIWHQIPMGQRYSSDSVTASLALYLAMENILFICLFW